MRGWTEEEIHNKALMAPCGLYCGACSIYISHRDNNPKLKEKLARAYGCDPSQIECRGCMQTDSSDVLFVFCRTCPIRECVREKGYYSCHQCDDFPCKHTANFPIPVGRRVMQRAIPIWRELVQQHGDDLGSIAWARQECERCHCPDCGAPLFRGAIRCRECGHEVADFLDGRNP